MNTEPSDIEKLLVDLVKKVLYSEAAGGGDIWDYRPEIKEAEDAISKLIGHDHDFTRGDRNINKVIECFKECFGTTKASKYDRYAAKRLTDRHGAGMVAMVIQVLSTKQSEQYCPVVASLTQLEDKWVSVVRFLNAHKVKEVEI